MAEASSEVEWDFVTQTESGDLKPVLAVDLKRTTQAYEPSSHPGLNAAQLW